METIKHCYLAPIYLYQGYDFEGLGEMILAADFLIFEINSELTYDFITSLN